MVAELATGTPREVTGVLGLFWSRRLIVEWNDPCVFNSSGSGLQVVAEGGSGGPFDTVMGLPVHPLVVHAAVVLLPLAAIGLVAIILVPRWRGALGWLVMGGLVLATGAVFVAKESGEKLATRVGNPTVHAELGDQLPIMAGVLLVVGVAWFYLARRDEKARAKSTMTTVMGIVAILVAALNLVWVVRVGHSGAEATWAGQIKATEGSGPGAASGSFTLADVQLHNTPADCWTAIDGTVYDVSGYSKSHPGGVSHIEKMCGTDSTAYFDGQHSGQKRANEVLAGFKLGTLG